MAATCGSESDLRPSVWISRSGAVARGADCASAESASAGVNAAIKQKRTSIRSVYPKMIDDGERRPSAVDPYRKWITLGRAGGAAVPRISDEVSTLLDGDGLCQVAGLVYVAAAADGYVIGKELQGNDFD